MGIFDQFSSKRDIEIPVLILEANETEPEFVVEVRYVDGETQEDMLNSCRVRTRTGEWDTDRKKYREKWCRKVIRGWRGLTLANFRRLLPQRDSTNPEQFLEKFPDGEIPYSHEAACDLYREARAQDFVNVVLEAFRVSDDLLRVERELEEKKLKSMPDSSSG